MSLVSVGNVTGVSEKRHETPVRYNASNNQPLDIGLLKSEAPSFQAVPAW